MATHISELLKRNAHKLLGHEEVQELLDRLAAKAPKLVERVGGTFGGDGSNVVLLKQPTGPNGTAEFFTHDDVTGNVIVHSYHGNDFPRLRINEIHPRDNGVNTYSGPLTTGTYLLEIQVDRGSWTMTITP